MAANILIKKSSNLLKQKLSILNGIIGLSQKELEILEVMVREFPEAPASTIARKYIAIEVGLQNPNSINNYIRKLRIQGAILKQGTTYVLNPIITSTIENDELIITFK